MGTKEFLLWEQQSRDTIDVKRIYVDVAGDLVTGVLLSQIIYWFLPDKNGKTKLRVVRDGKEWLIKKREDWWGECRISTFQVDRALKKLEKIEVIQTKIIRFSGTPMKSIWLDLDKLIMKISEVVKMDFRESGKSTFGKLQNGLSTFPKVINIDNNKDNNKEYVREFSTPTLFDLTKYKNPDDYNEDQKKELMIEVYNQIKDSQIWREDVSRTTGLDQSETWHRIKMFLDEIKAKEDYFKPLREIKRHCVSWIKTHQPVTNGR